MLCLSCMCGMLGCLGCIGGWTSLEERGMQGGGPQCGGLGNIGAAAARGRAWGGGGALLWGTAAAPHSTHRGGGAGSMQHPSHSGLGAGSVRPHRDVGSMGTGKRRGCARVTVYGDSPPHPARATHPQLRSGPFPIGTALKSIDTVYFFF